MSDSNLPPIFVKEKEPPHIRLVLIEVSQLISALGNASGFIQAYLLRDDLTDYQREGAKWVIEKIEKATDVIHEKVPFV